MNYNRSKLLLIFFLFCNSVFLKLSTYLLELHGIGFNCQQIFTYSNRSVLRVATKGFLQEQENNILLH